MSEDQSELTRRVIGAAIEVHRVMGPGLLEPIYQKCMQNELARQGIPCREQWPVPLVYKGDDLDAELKMDFYFPGELVVELKAVEKIHPVHEAQLLTYMKLAHVHVGLLINFNVPLLKEGIKRMVL